MARFANLDRDPLYFQLGARPSLARIAINTPARSEDSTRCNPARWQDLQRLGNHRRQFLMSRCISGQCRVLTQRHLPCVKRALPPFPNSPVFEGNREELRCDGHQSKSALSIEIVLGHIPERTV